MEPNKILKSPLLDLIFDNRNKAYGAYELRVTYPERIKKSLLITLGVGVLVFSGVVWASSGKKEDRTFNVGPPVTLSALPAEPLKPLPPVPKKVVAPQAKQNVPQQIFVKPTLVDQTPPEPPAPNAALTNITISTVTTPGDGPGEIPSEGDPTGIVEKKKTEEPPGGIWPTVEVEAEFDGDWRKFLKNNLRGDEASENNAPSGTYRVMIQFVVDIDGSLSNIIALTNNGYGMEEEAIRVIRQSKKWRPAFQNGIHVKAYRKQLITFVIEE